MEVSTFRNFKSKTPESSTLEAMAECIRTDRSLAQVTALYRRDGSKQIKEESPMFAVAALMSGGKSKADITAMTGLSLVDLDHVPVERLADIRDKAAADPHTVLLYTTISGCGLRIIFSYEIDRGHDLGQQQRFYTLAFSHGNDYYERLLGVGADRQCKNVNRLSGLAHDPAVYFNADAKPFGSKEILAEGKAAAAHCKAERQTRQIQEYYDCVIAPRLRHEGIVYAPGSHNVYVMRVGYMLAGRRYSLEKAVGWAVGQFADYDGTEQVMRSCYNSVAEERQRHRRERCRERDAIVDIGAIKDFLGSHVRLRFNVVTGRIECCQLNAEKEEWQPITDRMVNSLWVEMSTTTAVGISDIFRVIESDYTPPHEPFREYLGALAPWYEGDRDYIAELAATIKVRGERPDSPLLFAYALRKWLVAMVASWLDPTVVNNVILVLIGEQGSYKTTWFNGLLPPQLQRYFYTKTNLGRMTKDDMLVLSQYALVCCEELDSMRPQELNQLKAAVTMPATNERAAYARFHETRPHIASFCGTGNNLQFLTDPTGNRRWLPFEVESITSPRDHPFCHDGIFAQALWLYRHHFQYWFSAEEIRRQAQHNANFEAPNMELEIVSIFFRRPNDGETPTFMTASRALQQIGGSITQKLSVVCIGRAFRELGFKEARCQGVRGYWVMERSSEDIRLYLKNVTPDS
ncbi:MAG: virulence protein E [Prevotella sp.]|nr:virulence protein E [Prevotella sp.]MBO5156234.1 virulence protein E [Prevotella sp.]MBO5204607.1 virulence protein E [Prevotella sp.]